MVIRKNIWEKEWVALSKKEYRLIEKYKKERKWTINDKIEKIVPEKLKNTLNQAFYKAFKMLFKKGNKIIDKSYLKKRHMQEHKIQDYAIKVRQNRKSVKAVHRKANKLTNVNLLFSGVEGIGLGLLGIGLPDIPLFLAVILRSIYEISMVYGFEYSTISEQVYILRVIRTSLVRGDEFLIGNKEINDMIENKEYSEEELELEIEKAANALSQELLYMKFVQGVPVAGVIGGVFDSICLKRITGYAKIKYSRRYIIHKQKCK